GASVPSVRGSRGGWGGGGGRCRFQTFSDHQDPGDGAVVFPDCAFPAVFLSSSAPASAAPRILRPRNRGLAGRVRRVPGLVAGPAGGLPLRGVFAGPRSDADGPGLYAGAGGGELQRICFGDSAPKEGAIMESSLGGTMIKADIVDLVVDLVAVPRAKAATAVETVIESMRSALGAGDRIELRGFGVFQVKRRKRGIGRNPKTGVEVTIPPGNTIRFKPGKDLRDLP